MIFMKKIFKKGISLFGALTMLSQNIPILHDVSIQAEEHPLNTIRTASIYHKPVNEIKASSRI